MRALKIRALVGGIVALILPTVAIAANNLSPKEFDIACAMTTSAELGLIRKAVKSTGWPSRYLSSIKAALAGATTTQIGTRLL